MTSSAFSPSRTTEIKEEILLLWSHWKCFTSDTQTLIAHLLKKVYKDFENKFDKDTIAILQ